MAAGTLTLQGSIVVGGGACDAACPGGVSTKVVPLSFPCGTQSFGAIQSTDQFVSFSSLDFVDVNILEGFSDILFLLIQATGGTIDARLYAALAVVPTAGTFPTGFSGGETLLLSIDGGVTVTSTFDVADQSNAQVANRINAAYAIAGLPGPAVVNATSGQVDISSIKTGADGSVNIVSGTALAALGLSAGVTAGTGSETSIASLFLQDFPVSNAPSRIQLKGTAQINIMVAGTPV